MNKYGYLDISPPRPVAHCVALARCGVGKGEGDAARNYPGIFGRLCVESYGWGGG